MIFKLFVLSLLAFSAVIAISSNTTIKEFKDDRVIQLNCNGLQSNSIDSILNCVNKTNVVYCNVGEIIVKSSKGVSCQTFGNRIYYLLNRKSDISGNQHKEKFYIESENIFQFAILEENNTICPEKCNLKTLTMKKLGQLETLLAVIPTEMEGKLPMNQTLYLLPTNGSTQCEIDYIQFADNINSPSKAWKIAEIIIESLSLIFILLVLAVFIYVGELRTTITGKCVISYCTAHILHFIFFYVYYYGMNREAMFLSFLVTSLELSKYIWINVVCYHKYKMMG